MPNKLLVILLRVVKNAVIVLIAHLRDTICVELILGSTQNIVFATRNLLHYIESRNMKSPPVQLILRLFGMYQKGDSLHSVS